MITFLLGDALHNVQSICPNTTILEYLRLQLRKVGTKEGCATGDCGACTVVVGELDGETIKYKNINSCISPIGTLHGKQLLTVEDLEYREKLHPTQQALVKCHGSQCGYCTPGFVMTLFAMSQNSLISNQSDIEEYLAGNLCRCTGYKPIIEAAKTLYQLPVSDKFSVEKGKDWASVLLRIRKLTPINLTHSGRQYFHPRTEDELADLHLKYPEAQLCAGGTDLMLAVTQQHKSLEVMISLSSVEELNRIVIDSQKIILGSAVTYSQCHDVIANEYPDLALIIQRLGSRQIRNMATIGGNIANASPIGDMPPALIALNAKLVLRKGDTSREVSIEDYFIDYKETCLQTSEYISSIIIPKLSKNVIFKMYKVSKRLDDDISAVAAAFMLKIKAKKVVNIKIAYGGMAAIPKRSFAAEQSLIGKSWNKTNIIRAMTMIETDFNPLSDVRASSTYRVHVAKNLLYKCYLESLDKSLKLRINEYE